MFLISCDNISSGVLNSKSLCCSVGVWDIGSGIGILGSIVSDLIDLATSGFGTGGVVNAISGSGSNIGVGSVFLSKAGSGTGGAENSISGSNIDVGF